MMRAMRVAAAMMIADIGPSIGQEILDGTWKLVTSNRTTTATGASIDTFSPDPKGYIMYGKDGRMMVLQTRGDRPRPESVEGLTDDQRVSKCPREHTGSLFERAKVAFLQVGQS